MKKPFLLKGIGYIMSYFSHKLKQLRTSKNYSQRELAELLFVSTNIISSYEQNLRQPSIDMLVKLSNEFGVSIDYLLNNDEHKIISVNGLTDKQIKLVSMVIDEFRELNHT